RAIHRTVLSATGDRSACSRIAPSIFQGARFSVHAMAMFVYVFLQIPGQIADFVLLSFLRLANDVASTT
ncbi:MAG TPA: hypothetical protein VFN11_12750, partial [Ktedonobacterales bacterium]|nr:hypothetical protein [Ktedonobacterales bacterium]